MQTEQRADIMATETTTPRPRYFRIPGGNTVLQADGGSWTRWDEIDGPVATSIWRLDSPGLTELNEEDARALIGTLR